MRLIRLEAVNYCNHRNTVLDFKAGVTAITGPNGCGKSNLLDAILALVTGNTRNVGNKGDNINDQAGKKEKSYLYLKFEHGGVTGEVTRFLRPTGPAELKLSSGQEIVGEKEVTQTIQQLLQVDAKTIDDILIVAQRDLFGFIDQLPATRAKHFQMLFGTAAAEQLHSTINSFVQSKADTTNWRALADGLNQQLQACNEQLTTLKSGFPQASLLADPFAGRLAEVAVAINEATRYEALFADKQRHIADIARLSQELVPTRSQQQGAALVLKGAMTLLEQLGDTDWVHGILKLQEVANSQAAVLAQKRRQHGEQVANLANYAWSQAYDPAVLTAEVAAYTTNVKTWTVEHDTLLSKKNNVCGACKRPFDTGATEADLARWAQLATDIVMANAQIKMRTDAIEAIRQRKQLEASVQALADQIAAMQITTVEPEKLQQATQLLQAKQSAQLAVDSAKNSLATAEAALRLQTEILGQRQAALAECDRMLQAYAGRNIDLVALRAEASQLQIGSTQWQQARTRLTTLEAGLAGLQRQLAELSIKEAATVAGQLRLAKLRKIGEVFHRDAAPRYVAYQNLQALEREMNHLLELFDTAYRVTAKETLSFEATFFDGRVQPVERLSGGQAAIVALVFRLAMATLFAGHVGLLILDEPTAFQDEHHIRGFEPVIQQLRQYASTRGLQCIIVTHEQALAPLFDQAIQL